MSRYHSVPISCVQKPSAALSWWHQLSRYWWRWLCRLRWWTRRWRRRWRRMWRRMWTRRWRCVQKSLAACPLLVAPLSCQASSVPPVPLPRPVDLCSPASGTVLLSVVQWYSATVSTILSQCPPCWLLELWRDSIAGPSLRANHLHWEPPDPFRKPTINIDSIGSIIIINAWETHQNHKWEFK